MFTYALLLYRDLILSTNYCSFLTHLKHTLKPEIKNLILNGSATYVNRDKF